MKNLNTYITIVLLALAFGFCSKENPQIKDSAEKVVDEAKSGQKPTLEDAYKKRERDFK
jgi:hypothetical protein